MPALAERNFIRPRTFAAAFTGTGLNQFTAAYWNSSGDVFQNRNPALRKTHQRRVAFSETDARTRFFERFQIETRLDFLRMLPEADYDCLLAAGRRIAKDGTTLEGAFPPDPLRGVALEDGSLCVLPARLLDRGAFALHQAWKRGRDFSRMLPVPQLHQPLRHKLHAAWSLQSPDRTWDEFRSRVYRLAYFLARLPEEMQECIIAARPHLDGMKPADEVFSEEFMRYWTPWQYEKAWQWRKHTGPGGSSKADYKKSFAALDIKQQAFITKLAFGVADYLRHYRRSDLLRLVECGRRMHELRHTLDQGEFTDPLAGVPLQDGSRASLEPAFLADLAFSHHVNWMLTREWTWDALPVSLQQPEREEHVRWDREAIDRRYYPDMRNIYGICYALYLLGKEKPEILQMLLSASPY